VRGLKEELEALHEKLEIKSGENGIHVKVPDPTLFDGSKDSNPVKILFRISSSISRQPTLAIETK